MLSQRGLSVLEVGAEVQARPQLESTTWFQSLLVKRIHSAFNLNPVVLSELAEATTWTGCGGGAPGGEVREARRERASQESRAQQVAL